MVEPENSSSAASERDLVRSAGESSSETAPSDSGKLAPLSRGEPVPALPGDAPGERAPRFPGELKLGELELPQPAGAQERGGWRVRWVAGWARIECAVITHVLPRRRPTQPCEHGNLSSAAKARGGN